MAGKPEGTPIWIDASLPDLDAAKSFYAEGLGRTFEESSAEFGNYTQAYSGGRKVAGLAPTMPEGDRPTAWCLFFASPDVEATAARVRDHGGRVVFEPMTVGDFGRMAIATVSDQQGAAFSVIDLKTTRGELPKIS